MKRRWVLRTCLVALLALVIGAGAFAGGTPEGKAEEASPAKPIELKFAHMYAEGQPQGMAAARFVELAEKYSGGKVAIKLYPGGQLGTQPALVEGVRTGTHDLYQEVLNVFEPFAPIIRYFNTPFVFRSQEHYEAFLGSPLFEQEALNPIEENGIVFLNSLAGWNWTRGPFRVIIAKRKPIQVPQDVQGMKLRLSELKSWVKGWEAIGANPVVIPWGEVYLALQQGVADAVTSPMANVWDAKFTEVAKYVTRLEEFYQTDAVAVNKSRWDSLPKDVQDALVKACTEAGAYYADLVAQRAVTDLEKMKTEHRIQYFEVDHRPWVEVGTKGIRNLEASGDLTAGMYDRIQAIKE